MIRISQMKLRAGHAPEEVEREARRLLHLRDGESAQISIARQSVDARKKPDIFYVYTVDCTLAPERERQILKKNRSRNIAAFERPVYTIPVPAAASAGRPVIVGAGPAGLFCALVLAMAGQKPLLIDRGDEIGRRREKVESFWKGGALDPASNVQFGEGGAGTFSDGKLNTGIRDPQGRIRFVLETFVEHGAPQDILYSYKPHIGTDCLQDTIASIRRRITDLGGEVWFRHCLTDIQPAGAGEWALTIECGVGGRKTVLSRQVVLAPGHSARDTFLMLHRRSLAMEAKAFAVGLRVQHPQRLINEAMYGTACPADLPASPYRLAHTHESGRGVYSFCMCPGGYVVNASSEPGRTAVNGMSLHARDGANANSAIVVTVTPEDCAQFLRGAALSPTEALPELFAGVAFQRMLEERAFRAADGAIPLQTYHDFCRGEVTQQPGAVEPQVRGLWKMADVSAILPADLTGAIRDSLRVFDRQIPGFASDDALLAGVESRTSSPLRILRGPDRQCAGFPGIYPCGEGAGYAGGITSAAVDGIRTAEAILAAAGEYGLNKL